MCYFQVFFATFVWGAAYPFTKHLVGIIPVILLVFIRAFFASILFFIIFRPDLKKLIQKRMIFKILIMSVLGVTLQQYSQGYALTLTLATNAGFLIALTPIVIVFIELLLGANISASKLLAFLFGVSGTLLVSYSSGRLNFNLPSTVGDFIFITSAFTWAAYVILTKRWFNDYSQIEITFYTMFVSVFTLVPFIWKIDILSELSKIDLLGWISMFYLCFLSSFLGYMFWNNAVEKLGPVVTSYFIYDEPFAAMISAYFITSEKVSAVSFMGGMCILVGVYFILTEKKKEYERIYLQ